VLTSEPVGHDVLVTPAALPRTLAQLNKEGTSGIHHPVTHGEDRSGRVASSVEAKSAIQRRACYAVAANNSSPSGQIANQLGSTGRAARTSGQADALFEGPDASAHVSLHRGVTLRV